MSWGFTKSRMLTATTVALIAALVTSGPSYAGGDPNNPDVPSDCTLSHRLYIGGDFDVDVFPDDNSGATASSDLGYWVETWALDNYTASNMAVTSTQTIKNTTGTLVPARTLYNINQSYVSISTYEAAGPTWPLFRSNWDQGLLGYLDSKGGLTRIYNDLAHTDQLLPTKTVADLQPAPPGVLNFGAGFSPASGTLATTDPVTDRFMASKLDPGQTSSGLKNHFNIDAGGLNMNDVGIFTWSYITGQVCAPIPTIVGTSVVLAPGAEPPVQTLTGTGTYPGDTIEIFDEHGTSVGTAVLQSDKTWSLPGVTVPLGVHTYSVTETDYFQLIGHNKDIFKVTPTPVTPPTPPTPPTPIKPTGKTSGTKTPRSLPNTGA